MYRLQQACQKLQQQQSNSTSIEDIDRQVEYSVQQSSLQSISISIRPHFVDSTTDGSSTSTQPLISLATQFRLDQTIQDVIEAFLRASTSPQLHPDTCTVGLKCNDQVLLPHMKLSLYPCLLQQSKQRHRANDTVVVLDATILQASVGRQPQSLQNSFGKAITLQFRSQTTGTTLPVVSYWKEPFQHLLERHFVASSISGVQLRLDGETLKLATATPEQLDLEEDDLIDYKSGDKKDLVPKK